MGAALITVLAMLLGGFAAVSGVLGGGTEHVAQKDDGGTGQEGTGDPASSAQQPGSGTHPATPSPSAGCDLNQVTVTASTDKPSYAPGENPLLSLKVTNGGQADCEVNLGTSQMEFLVMSGSDRIFSSKDCQAASDDLIKTIQPGNSEIANFPWPRNRSVEGCTEVAVKPGGGGATYTFTARLGNKQSPKAVFQLG